MLKNIGAWLVDRLGLARVIEFALRHPVPRRNTMRSGWMYALGVATLGAFLLQLATGIALATHYIPSPQHAFDSLRYINEEVWFGGFLRAVHYFGASAMVVLITAHMIRVLLTGSYKFPREMTWVVGVVLLGLTMAMALTGQLLRWDQDGLWTVSVASHFVGRVPFIGEQLARFVLAGDRVGGATLSRFFVFHAVLIPLLILLTIGVHVYLVLHHGISEPPDPGRKVDRRTYRKEYEEELRLSERRYWPDEAWREVVAAAGVILVVLLLAYVLGPKGPSEPPDPASIAADPRPDWYLRWYYALLWVKPRGTETLVMVYLPLVAFLALLLLPFVFNEGERSLRRRPWAVVLVVLTVAGLGVLTDMGVRPEWEIDFQTTPLTAADVGVGEGDVWQGAQLFHARGCQYCHAVRGRGGSYGPDLTNVARRLPVSEIVTRTLNGVGDMPPYRDILLQEEMNAIVAFLRSLEGG